MTGPAGSRGWARVYRPKWFWMVLVGGAGLAMIAGGIALALVAPSDPHGRGLWVQVALGACLAVMGAGSVAAVVVDRILLSEDAIEVRQLGRGRRRARRDEVRGLRVVANDHVRTIELALEPGTKSIKIGLWHAMDAELDAWLRSLPDLDAEDRARSEAELLARTDLGPNVDDRVAALARARRIARVVEVTGLVISTWAFVYPRPYPLVLALVAAVPLVAVTIVATGRGIYQLDGRRNDPRPMILTAFLMPGFVLTLRAMLEVEVMDLWALVPWTALVAGPLVVLAVAPEPNVRARWKNGLLLAPFLTAYGWGVMVHVDVMLDRAPREIHRVEVLEKRTVGGRAPSWELELAPWGSIEDRDSYRVPRALFQATEVGSQVCVELAEGALGARWYAVRACR